MKTMSETSFINPVLIGLAVLAAAVVFLVMRGTSIPLLSNIKTSLVILLVVGMAMCTQGIGLFATAGQWTHPLSIVGYLLGAMILILSLNVFFNLRLPIITLPQQAFLAIAILLAAKLANSFVHYFLLDKGI